MNPNKAYHLGIRPQDCKIESYSHKHRGDWLVIHKGKILTSSPSVQAMLKWRHELWKHWVAAS